MLQSSLTPRSPRGNLSALQVTTPVKSLQNGVSPLWTFRPGAGPHAWTLFLSKHPFLQPFCSCHKSLHQPHTLPSDCSLCFLGLTPACPGEATVLHGFSGPCGHALKSVALLSTPLSFQHCTQTLLAGLSTSADPELPEVKGCLCRILSRVTTGDRGPP